MPNPISADKRDAINQRLANGEAPHGIAIAVGVDRSTVRRYAKKLMESGGLPAVQALQVANIPAAQAYVEGDDDAIRDLLGLMGLKAQAETMYTLTRARNLYQESRSVDVGVFADFLRHSADMLAALNGPLEEWASAMNGYMHGSHPKVVDRLMRAGLM